MENRFNIFAELDGWSKELDPWQRCALSKLVRQADISDEDVQEILGEFLLDKGLDKTQGERKTYELGTPTSKGEENPQIILKAIKDVIGVNALAPEQELDVGPQLTVIYGPNGSGKSGYSRILKASCFTRSQTLDILGDIRVTKEERPKPSATFVINEGEEAKFSEDSPCLALRDNFAVFDSTCIRAHINDKNKFNITPYLFDVFPRMVAAIRAVNTKLDELINKNMPDVSAFVIESGCSEVSDILNELKASSDVAKLRELGSFTEGDEKRLVKAKKELDELLKADTETLIKTKTRAKEDISQLEQKIRKATDTLSGQAVANIKAQCEVVSTLRQQSDAITASSLKDEPLQPIGTFVWKALVEAAVAYNDEVYPDKGFPAEIDGVRCVLCQQTLKGDAKDRLARFLKCAKSDTESKLNIALQKVSELLKPVEDVDINFFAKGVSSRRTIEDIEATLLEVVDSVIVSLAGHRESIISSTKTNIWTELPSVDSSVLDNLVKHKQALEARITALKEKKTEEVIQKLKQEVCLLEERKALSSRLPEVLKAVEKLQWADKAKMVTHISSRFVTDKQKALMSKLVAEGFRKKFIETCHELELDIPFDFTIAGSDGETKRKLGFTTPGGGGASPSQVLSEGEQTAAALADFLTEVAIDETTVGVIFDDPVSSLDHDRKELIAKRLVQEATTRQVIIFTHDIIFSHFLASEAEKLGDGFNFTGRTVARKHDGSIGCVGNIIFPHSHYEGEAAKRAKDRLDKAKESTGEAKQNELEKACGCLRTAYENFIQRRLFNNVVGRWRENIMFKLDDLYVDEGIVKRVDEQMAKLSRCIDAHSHSERYKESPLTEETIQKGLEEYYSINKAYNEAKNKWLKDKGETAFN